MRLNCMMMSDRFLGDSTMPNMTTRLPLSHGSSPIFRREGSSATGPAPLLIQSFRYWLAAIRNRCWRSGRLAEEILRDRYGARPARAILRAQHDLFFFLLRHARGRFACHPAGCRSMTEDEARLCALLSEATGEPGLAAFGLASDLVGPGHAVALIGRASRLGELLTDRALPTATPNWQDHAALRQAIPRLALSYAPANDG